MTNFAVWVIYECCNLTRIKGGIVRSVTHHPCTINAKPSYVIPFSQQDLIFWQPFRKVFCFKTDLENLKYKS